MGNELKKKEEVQKIKEKRDCLREETKQRKISQKESVNDTKESKDQ